MTTVETQRLIIRGFDSKDKIDIFDMLSDQDTCYDDGGYEPFSSMNKDFIELMKNFESEKGRYVIELKESKKVIGLIHLMKAENRAVPAYEIGYIVNKKYRRKGYAFEALNTVMKSCFANDIELITAGVFSFNEKSMQLLEKLGFIKEGITYKGANHCKYGLIDMINYYIEKPIET